MRAVAFGLLSSAPLSWDGASSCPPVQAAVRLTDGWRGLRLAEVALAAGQTAFHDQAAHHAGLNLFKVISLCAYFSLQEADVCLIPSLLLREGRGGGRDVFLKTKRPKYN